MSISLFLTLYMYISWLKNVHVQLDNFSTLRLLEHVLLIPLCFFFHTVAYESSKTGKEWKFLSILETLCMNCWSVYTEVPYLSDTNMVFLDTEV